jgi:membrane protease YdiL (CAAX protease family)
MTVELQSGELLLPDKSDRIRGWQLLALPITAMIVFLLGFSAASAIAAAVGIAAGLTTPLQIEAFFDDAGENFYWVEGQFAIFYLICLFYLWRFYRRRGEHLLPSRSAADTRSVSIGALSGVALALLFTVLTEILPIEFNMTPEELQSVPETYVELAFGLLGIAVLAPFVEEVYFRDLFLKWARQRWSVGLLCSSMASCSASFIST